MTTMKSKKLLKWLLLAGTFCIFYIPPFTFIIIMIDKKTNPIVIFLEDKFHKPRREFIVQAFTQIPQAMPGQTALDLAADINESDLIFPLEKGYRLIAIDTQSVYYDLTIPDQQRYASRISIAHKLDIASLPQLDLVMASFILPFYNPARFRQIWQDLTHKIKPGGYFLGNFFGADCSVFPDSTGVIVHTRQEVTALFDMFRILHIQEVKQKAAKQDGIEHYYEVFAQKKNK